MRRWHDLIVKNKEDLARIMVLEQGKPISEARGEIDYACSFIDFYAEEAKRMNIESVTSHLPNAEVELWREPVGVAALITPWNFPCAMITPQSRSGNGRWLHCRCTPFLRNTVFGDCTCCARARSKISCGRV